MFHSKFDIDFIELSVKIETGRRTEELRRGAKNEAVSVRADAARL